MADITIAEQLLISTSAFIGVNQAWGNTFLNHDEISLTKITANIGYAGTPGNVYIKIYETDSGLPTGTELCTATIASSLIPEEKNDHTFVFPAPCALEADTQYAFAMSSDEGSMTFSYQNTNVYAEGLLVNSTDGGDSWGSIPSVDTYFIIVGEEDTGPIEVEAAGNTDAVSTMTGTAAIAVFAASTVDAASTLSGKAAVLASAAATVIAESSFVGATALLVGPGGTFSVASALDGSIDLTASAEGSASATSGLDGTAFKVGDAGVAGSLDAVLTLDGGGDLTASVGGSFDVISALTGDSGLAASGAGNIDIISTLGGDASLVALAAGSFDAVSTLAGQLTDIVFAAGSFDAASALDGDAESMVATDIEGNMSGDFLREGWGF